jgi:pantoate--beta-alanine ligase
MQFNDKGDHERYPRTVQADLDLLAAKGVDMVILPTDQEMHPEPIQFQVVPSGLSDLLEGASRPGHFAGVATVVMKLFHILSEGRAYFGEKDFQQLAIIKRMVVEFHLPIAVIGVAIVREADGLAMSSRNSLLSEEERAAAPALHSSIEVLRRGYASGERRVEKLVQLAKTELAKEPLVKLDYLHVVNPATLDLLEFAEDDSRILVAANIGLVRLIDNSAVGAIDAQER